MLREWVYTVSGIDQAVMAIRDLARLPSPPVTSLMVAMTPSPVVWYCVAAAAGPSDDDADRIERILGQAGRPAGMTSAQLLSLKPPLLLTGPAGMIFAVLRLLRDEGQVP